MKLHEMLETRIIESSDDITSEYKNSTTEIMDLDEGFFKDLVAKSKRKFGIIGLDDAQNWSLTKILLNFKIANKKLLDMGDEYRVGLGRIRGDKKDAIMIYTKPRYGKLYFEAGDIIQVKELRSLELNGQKIYIIRHSE